jgi:hypothetical protein
MHPFYLSVCRTGNNVDASSLSTSSSPYNSVSSLLFSRHCILYLFFSTAAALKVGYHRNKSPYKLVANTLQNSCVSLTVLCNTMGRARRHVYMCSSQRPFSTSSSTSVMKTISLLLQLTLVVVVVVVLFG